jgi:hypothetical protein
MISKEFDLFSSSSGLGNYYTDSMEEYTTEFDQNVITMDGNGSFQDISSSPIRFLSGEETMLYKEFQSSYNLENNEFSVVINTFDENHQIIDVYVNTFEPIYVFEEDHYEIYIEYENYLISVLDFLVDSNIDFVSCDITAEFCFDDGGNTGGGGLVLTIFAITISEVGNDITTTIVNTTTAIIEEIVSFFNYITQIVSGVITSETVTYTFNVSGVDYETRELTPALAASMSNSSNIYIALADKDIGLMYITTVSIDDSTAASILLAVGSQILNESGTY